MRILTALLVSTLLLLTSSVTAQESQDQRTQLRERLKQRFDTDGDGRLSPTERSVMRDRIKQWRERQDSAPSTLSGLYGQTAPSVELKVENVRLPDTGQGKDLEVKITYPDGSGPYPVIVWSHGLFGSQDNYRPLVEHWARHGYLVLQPTHSDSLKYTKDDFQGFDRGLGRYMTDWASRPLDVTRVLDEVKNRKLWRELADLTRIGVGGHSFGAHTTMLLSGAAPANDQDLSDHRAQAFLAISPQGEGRVFDSNSWNQMRGPIFFISGDNDGGQGGQPASWRRAPYDTCPAGQKYLLWIKDAHHSFGGISGARSRIGGPANPDHVEIVKSATLMYWDAKLKKNKAANKTFEAGGLNTQFQAKAKWTKK